MSYLARKCMPTGGDSVSEIIQCNEYNIFWGQSLLL